MKLIASALISALLSMPLAIVSFTANAATIESMSPPKQILQNGQPSYREVRVSCLSRSDARFIRQAQGLKQWCVSHSLSSCSSDKLRAATKACKIAVGADELASATNTVAQQAAPQKPASSPEVNSNAILPQPVINQELALALKKLEIDQQKLDLRKQQLNLRKQERDLQRASKAALSGGSE